MSARRWYTPLLGMLVVSAAVVAPVTVAAAVARAQSAAPRPPVPGAPAGVTAFVDVNVVPMDTERVLPKQTVLIQNGWITALGPTARVKVPPGAVRLDGRGKYLLPGLADMHAHLLMSVPGADSAQAERLLFLFLANGVTTIRNMDYDSQSHGELTLRFRARAAAGELWSPRIYTAGQLTPNPNGPPMPAESIPALVTAYKAAGYDFIKMRSNYNQGATLDSLAAAARRAGLPFSGHVHDKLEPVLSVGYGSIEHLMGYKIWGRADPSIRWPLKSEQQAVKARALTAADSAILLRQRQWLAQQVSPAKLRELAEATARAGVWNTPTMALSEVGSLEAKLQGPAAFPEFRYVSPGWHKVWNFWFQGTASGSIAHAELSGSISATRQLIKALQDAGAGLLLGTDPPMLYMVPGFSVHRELAAFVRAGLTPYQALATGTKNVARFFGTLDETGTVAVGKRADLVLLNGNPLQDIGNTAQPAGVMIGGRWLPRLEIDRRLAEIAAAAAGAP
jgi:cytosine/adenosine deaminase-related metal-dependent hydrolase